MREDPHDICTECKNSECIIRITYKKRMRFVWNMLMLINYSTNPRNYNFPGVKNCIDKI